MEAATHLEDQAGQRSINQLHHLLRVRCWCGSARNRALPMQAIWGDTSEIRPDQGTSAASMAPGRRRVSSRSHPDLHDDAELDGFKNRLPQGGSSLPGSGRAR